MGSEISVVLTYAGEAEFVGQALDSVYRQTTPCELVISVDTTAVPRSVAEIEINRNLRSSGAVKSTQIVFSEKVGPSAARNLGIVTAKGKYIICLDADDKFAVNCLERSAAVLNSEKNVGIVYGEVKRFGLENGLFYLRPYSESAIALENCIYSSAMFRKKDWELVGGYDDDLIFGQEDWDFWLKIVGLDRKVVKLPKPIVFFYRARHGSRSASFSRSTGNIIWTYDRITNNNINFMSKHVEVISHRRIFLEVMGTRSINIHNSKLRQFLKRIPGLKRIYSYVRRQAENG
jgi:glycosyltransferase involved in cell wall biosynthesis